MWSDPIFQILQFDNAAIMKPNLQHISWNTFEYMNFESKSVENDPAKSFMSRPRDLGISSDAPPTNVFFFEIGKSKNGAGVGVGMLSGHA